MSESLPPVPTSDRRPPIVHRTRIKICGVMSVEDAHAAAEAGVDAVGMILYATGARRMIDANTARDIAIRLPPFVAAVGVMKDAASNRIRQLMAHVPLGAVQLHGKESVQDARSCQPVRVIKKVSATATLATDVETWANAIVPNLAGLLVESPAEGGTGVETDWSLVEQLDRSRLPSLIVAGGLSPQNVYDVVRRLRPWAVDVSSGVEEEFGRKSPRLLAEFVQAVREADQSLRE